MSRRRSLKVDERNRELLEWIASVKSEHPFWGYRRVWAYLRYIEGRIVNKKRVLRLMREHAFLAITKRQLRASRTPQRSKPRPTQPNQWWGIDMTKVMIETFGWVYIVVVLDWYTKKIVGHYVGMQSKTKHWLQALDRAVNIQFPDGVRDRDLHLMSDNGCQPTSTGFMKACHEMDIHQAFTSYNNPKGNADTERLMRTMKEELLWLHEWRSPFELAAKLEEWVLQKYNNEYLHSTLGYVPPAVFENQWRTSHGTLLQNAC